MLEKVISGGQTGADRGALVAAKAAGLQTGGWMPLGFTAKDGSHPEFAAQYGIKEHHSPNYPPRTRNNIKESDGTIRFASNWNHPGEKVTLRYLKELHKPHIDVDINSPNAWTPDDIVTWLKLKKIKILNVAGNSEITSPGIQTFVASFMMQVFDKLLGEKPSGSG